MSLSAVTSAGPLSSGNPYSRASTRTGSSIANSPMMSAEPRGQIASISSSANRSEWPRSSVGSTASSAFPSIAARSRCRSPTV